ncbi:hypothetical protein COT47_02320 [Candidatus Woesearchaeota archaeon CG08_land_8_20_14_0_20_43_7]|nr:MAG: hypothetical protein COT47_02320 [Candidatus Woesearchaeota archaeon CG08_land_8_20_14_0_20_43_7]
MDFRREKKKIRAAFGKVKVDMHGVQDRLDELEGDIYRNIRLNLKELKFKLADGSITTREYDERYKRILDAALK